jgi:hypothetical protein
MPFAPGEFTCSRVGEFVKASASGAASGERVRNSVSGKDVWRDVRRASVSIGLSVESELVCGERVAGVNWLVGFGKLSVVSRLSSP